METAIETTSNQPAIPASRGPYGEINARHVPAWVTATLKALDGNAWTTDIESDKKHRGSSINVDVYSCDEARQLAVVQVRQCVFHPRRHPEVRKNYFLVGRNENGNAFAHPLEFRRSKRVERDNETGVLIALSRVWACREEDVEDIVRNGDVAFVPVLRLPDGCVEVVGGVTVRGSHHVSALQGGRVLRAADGTHYVTGKAKIKHSKGQHPAAKVKGGIWRVQEGVRGEVWGFSRPTAD